MRRFTKTLVGFGFLLSATSSALTLEDYVRKVWDSSRQLKSLADEVTIASNDRWRRFTPNEPQAFFIDQDNGGWQQAGLTLAVPFPGKSLLLSENDSARARSARLESEAAKIELAKSAVDTYLDCASSRETIEILSKNLLDLQTFTQTLEKLYERGHSTQAETLAAKLQLRSQESDLSIAQARTQVLCDRLNTLLPHRIDFDAAEIPEDIPASLIHELGGESSEALHAKSVLETATAQHSTAIWKQLPDITLSAFQNRYFVAGSSPVGKPLTYSFQATVTIPIFALFNEAPAVRKEEAGVSVQSSQAETALRTAISAQQQASVEFEKLTARLIAIEREDLPMAEAMMESSFSSYRSGRLGFAELMLSRRLFNDLRTQRLQLKVNRLQLRMRCLDRCGKEAK